MRFFVQVNFWVGVALFIIHILEMGIRDWPEIREPKSLGQHVAETLLSAAAMIWAGIVLLM